MTFGILGTSGEDELPGTELLYEDEQSGRIQPGHLHLKHGTGKNKDIILVPQPSNDPNDPLLWPRWKKEAAFMTIFYNAIVLATMPGPLLASSTFALAGILNVTLTKIAQLSGYQLLVVGATGPLVSVLARKYGKRPQFLFANVMGIIGTIICIVGRSNYNTLLAGRIIQGFGPTAFESLSLATIGDIYYIHERGWRTAFMVLTLACMASLVSIISGSITENLGYRDLFVIALPFSIFGLILTIFFIPETQFDRDALVRTMLHSNDSPTSGKEAGLDHDTTNEDEKLEPQTDHVETFHRTVTGATTGSQRPKKTYIQTLAIFSGIHDSNNIFKLFAEIFIHFLNPAVIWMLLISAVLVSFFAATAYIMSQIWSLAPYNLNTAQNGYFFAGAFVGGLFGVSAGWICDVSARAMTRANKGTFEAEFRVPANIIAALFLGIGWFVLMWDVNNPTPNGYFLGAFCHGCICFGVTVTSTSGGLYVLDAFRKHSTEIFIIQMMVKNFLFYAFSTFINSWELEKGAGNVFMIFGIVSMVSLLTCFPVYIFGKKNRKLIHGFHSRQKI